MDNQPTPPTPGSATQLEKARTRRVNAQRELDANLGKIMAQQLAIISPTVMAPSPERGGAPVSLTLLVHLAPGQLSDMLRTFVIEHKHLEVAIEAIIKQLSEKGLLDAAQLASDMAQMYEDTVEGQRRLLLQLASTMPDPKGKIVRS